MTLDQYINGHVFRSQVEHEQKALAGLYAKYPELNREYFNQRVDDLAEATGITKNVADADYRLFEELGILIRRREYGSPSNGMSTGRHYHWTILVAKEQAEQLLADAQKARAIHAVKAREAGNRKGSVSRRKENRVTRQRPDQRFSDVTLATSPVEETRAIAGPDAPSTIGDLAPVAMKALRKDELAALIEAARQYQGRNGAILAKLDELAAIAAEVGVNFSKEKAMESIQFDTDERLEAISLVLPYLDRMDETITRLTDQITNQSDKVRKYDGVVSENARLKRRVEELISRNVQTMGSYSRSQ